MAEFVYSNWLPGTGVEHRQRLVGHLSLDVVPLFRDLILRKNETFLHRSNWINVYVANVSQK